MDERPACVFKPEDKDESGCIPISDFLRLVNGCKVTEQVCFVTYSGGRMEPEEKPESKNKSKKASQELAVADEAEALAVVPSAPVQAQEVALTATKEIAPLLQNPTDFNGVLVALIAVAGGGAAWKFYSQFSKNKHEENMEKLRLESEKQKNNDHAQCDAKHMALSAKVEEMSAKLSAAEEKLANPPAPPPELDVDFDDMKDRLAKLEKSLKPAKAPAKPAKKK
jgi:hypothetical protein